MENFTITEIMQLHAFVGHFVATAKPSNTEYTDRIKAKLMEALKAKEAAIRAG